MKHVMLDAYGVEENHANDILHIYSLLNELAFVCGLEPIAPPQLIPYYYGKVKEDVGISSFVLLKGGHITIHTFPLRQCYFVDCLSSKDFDEKVFYDYFKSNLSFDIDKTIYQIENRSLNESKFIEYTPQLDFGPHYMSKIEVNHEPRMQEFFNFLEKITTEIGMDEITRAFVLNDNVDNPSFLSGIIIIAQSHISIHYSYKENLIYADCFSCAPFDFSTLNDAFKKLGEVKNSSLIPRGTKHLYKAKTKRESDVLLASTNWQRVVKKEN